MPINFSRLIVAFVLALAIPLQGLASVTAGICLAVGHHDAAAPAQHDHASGHDHQADGPTPEHDHGGGADPAHCAPCVACCAAASIAPAAQVFLPAEPPAPAVAVVSYLHPGFLPEKLDRPPLAL